MRVAQTTTFVVVLFKFLLFAVSWRQSMGWCLPFIRRSHSRSRMCRVGTTQPCLFRPQPPARHWRRWAVDRTDGNDSSPPLPLSTTNGEDMVPPHQRPRYDLGLGKNKPKKESHPNDNIDHDEERNEQEPSLLSSNTVALDWWMVPESVVKPESVSNRSMTSSSSIPSNITTAKPNIQYKVGRVVKDSTTTELVQRQPVKTRRMVARDNESQRLRGALWDEQHYGGSKRPLPNNSMRSAQDGNPIFNNRLSASDNAPPYPTAFYPDIDLSIPDTVYTDDGKIDLVWDLLRWEAYQNQQQQYEPLLVSFLHSSVLNHDTLESSLAFLLANRLQSPAMMISTQLQALLLSALQNCPTFRRKLRADMMAVRDRDPACHTLPDVFLYFKGFHALQSHRAAHVLWNSGRQVLALYLQSQVSQTFQIDLHPNATIGSGIMLDHGTGIVIGETATVGHNCSILHHVTLGGSGKKGVIRHPSVGNGVLLGAGATVLGPVSIGDGSQVGAGTLVISDLPAHCVAVGVPARIIGSFVDVTQQPSIGMNQIMEDRDNMITFESEGI